MIQGVSEKFNLTLTLQGVGYRAIVEKNSLILNLGYSHSIKLIIPNDVTIEVFKNTTLKLSSCNKQKLGEIGAKIKSFRFPEPYKGKGIRYENEIIKQKIGKTAKSTKK
jgi:large subunit ribosomal protein L6